MQSAEHTSRNADRGAAQTGGSTGEGAAQKEMQHRRKAAQVGMQHTLRSSSGRAAVSHCFTDASNSMPHGSDAGVMPSVFVVSRRSTAKKSTHYSRVAGRQELKQLSVRDGMWRRTPHRSARASTLSTAWCIRPDVWFPRLDMPDDHLAVKQVLSVKPVKRAGLVDHLPVKPVKRAGLSAGLASRGGTRLDLGPGPPLAETTFPPFSEPRETIATQKVSNFD